MFPYILLQQVQCTFVKSHRFFLLHNLLLLYIIVVLASRNYSTKLHPPIEAIRVIKFSHHYEDSIAALGEKHVVRNAELNHLICNQSEHK